MSFLQPFILFALPLIGLPILIHLINQNRYRTLHWGAMMFLLQAKRMARGMARLRYILILLARMLAVAGLIFAVSRPMAGGWLGWSMGGAADLTVIVLDRSVSMEEEDPGTARSKRETAVQKLSRALTSLGRGSQTVLFDAATGQKLELAAADLTELPEVGPTSTASDIPSLMQAVADHLQTSGAGRADVWVCSDLRESDWSPGSGRWATIRDQLLAHESLKMYVLAYQEPAPANLSLSVSGVHRRESAGGAELVMDLRITRGSPATSPVRVPVTFDVGGARSTLELDLTGSQIALNGHSLPIDRELQRGFGSVEIPRDANPADNIYQFVFAEPAVRKTVIVSDAPEDVELFRLAAATASEQGATYAAEVLPVAQAAAVDLTTTALLIWQAPLPDGLLAERLEAFVAGGGCILFVPPETPTEQAIFGTRWGQWKTPAQGEWFPVARWRTDADLLENTQNGQPLPVAQVQVARVCEILSEQNTVLAQLEQGPPLLVRTPQTGGAVWFCGTLPAAGSSNLERTPVSFYILVQRAIARGAAALGQARQYECGALSAAAVRDWKPLDERSSEVLISQRALHPGVYSSGDLLMALNRPLTEDRVETVGRTALDQMLGGLDLTVVSDTAGNTSALASEVWRVFLGVLIVALLAEGLLCLPDRRPPERVTRKDFTNNSAEQRAPSLSV